MTSLIRFKIVEIDSIICFDGKKKRTLKYPVRSISLVPEKMRPENIHCPTDIPEIFWQ
jgi:hypothetical protein